MFDGKTRENSEAKVNLSTDELTCLQVDVVEQ